MCVCVSEFISHFQCLWKTEEGMESRGAGVPGTHEQSDVCTEG